MTLECLLLIEQKIELDETPSNDEDAAEEGEEESEESEEEEEEEESSSSSSESEDEEDEEEVDIVTNGVKKLMANGNGASH